jgi:hypothetical protein
METLKNISAIVNGFIFIAIAGFHYYWAFGGKYGFNAVLPEIENSGKKAFVPGKIATFVVATLFLSVGLFFIIVGLQYSLFPQKATSYILYAITAATFIRAIGDFKYVGFFKKKSNSLFAINDAKYYSPLCVVISLLTLLLFY